MKARIKWVEGRTFVGESGSGHKLVLGTAFGPEGKTPGPSPMELVLIGAGGCSAYDVVHILERGREAVEDCVVELEADRAETEPRVFTRIHMHFVVKAAVFLRTRCAGQLTSPSRNIARPRRCSARRRRSATISMSSIRLRRHRRPDRSATNWTASAARPWATAAARGRVAQACGSSSIAQGAVPLWTPAAVVYGGPVHHDEGGHGHIAHVGGHAA